LSYSFFLPRAKGPAVFRAITYNMGMKLIASVPVFMAAFLFVSGIARPHHPSVQVDVSVSVLSHSILAKEGEDGDDGGENDGDCQSSDCSKGTGGK